MRRLLDTFRSIAAAVVLLAPVGCGPGGPTMYDVSGTVTIAGSPAQNVQVTFMPTDASLPVASGNVDGGGRYTLTSGASNRQGAAAGTYKVVLRQIEGGSEADVAARYTSGQGKAPVAKASFPKEYQAVDTTPKQVEVAATATNTIDIAIP
jgi:hypothetical protein